MKVLIHEDRSDGLDFLLEIIRKRGYKAGIAKDASEIMNMLSDERFNVVLTNGGYEELNPDQHFQMKFSSVFIIDISGQRKLNNGKLSKANLYLQRPFEVSKLIQAIDPDKTGN